MVTSGRWVVGGISCQYNMYVDATDRDRDDVPSPAPAVVAVVAAPGLTSSSTTEHGQQQQQQQHSSNSSRSRSGSSIDCDNYYYQRIRDEQQQQQHHRHQNPTTTHVGLSSFSGSGPSSSSSSSSNYHPPNTPKPLDEVYDSLDSKRLYEHRRRTLERERRQLHHRHTQQYTRPCKFGRFCREVNCRFPHPERERDHHQQQQSSFSQVPFSLSVGRPLGGGGGRPPPPLSASASRQQYPSFPPHHHRQGRQRPTCQHGVYCDYYPGKCKFYHPIARLIDLNPNDVEGRQRLIEEQKKIDILEKQQEQRHRQQQRERVEREQRLHLQQQQEQGSSQYDYPPGQNQYGENSLSNKSIDNSEDNSDKDIPSFLFARRILHQQEEEPGEAGDLLVQGDTHERQQDHHSPQEEDFYGNLEQYLRLSFTDTADSETRLFSDLPPGDYEKKMAVNNSTKNRDRHQQQQQQQLSSPSPSTSADIAAGVSNSSEKMKDTNATDTPAATEETGRDGANTTSTATPPVVSPDATPNGGASKENDNDDDGTTTQSVTAGGGASTSGSGASVTTSASEREGRKVFVGGLPMDSKYFDLTFDVFLFCFTCPFHSDHLTGDQQNHYQTNSF